MNKEGISFTVIGKVAIFQDPGEDEGPPPDGAEPLWNAWCSGANYANYTIPYDPGGYTWVYDPIWTSCSNGTTVEFIDVHYVVSHAYANTELGLVVGSNSPSWLYRTLETFDYCAPSAPPLDAAGLQDWDKWVYTINTFNGRPVNQRWDLAAKDFCSGYPSGYIDYWQIWVYYTAPTPTPTRTPTRTPLPGYRLEGKVFDGPVGDETRPLSGVTVQLWCSNNTNDQGVLHTSTTTNAAGSFFFSISFVCEYYNIIEVDPAGYSSVGATWIGGSVKTSNWIQYPYPLDKSVLNNNKFWDRRPVSNTPTRTSTQGPGPTWTPTRTPTRTATPTIGAQPGLVVDKRLLNTGPIVVSDTVTFEIYIRNSGNNIIESLYLSDVYNPVYLGYLGNADPPSDDNIDDGEITWNNVVTHFGPIAPGETVKVTVRFHANQPTITSLAQNCATASYTLQGVTILGHDCARIAIQSPPPEITVDKMLLSPPSACVSDTVVFGIAYTNTGSVPLAGIVLTDTYNTSQLSMRWPVMPIPETGELHGSRGFMPPFPPNASQFITFSFHAEAAASPAINTVRVQPVAPGTSGAAEIDSATVNIYAPGPCTGNAIVNGGFESTLALPWQLGGSMLPVRVSDQKHGGAYSTRLGYPSGGMPNGVGSTTAMRQMVFIPSNVAHAQLSFWYRVQTQDVAPFDQIRLITGGGPMMPLVNAIPLVDTSWRQATVSLDAYRGYMTNIEFVVSQDGALPTSLWIDDLQLCFAACGPLDGGNTPGGGPFCWKQQELPDYALEGVPDFSQDQANWVDAEGQRWSFDGPVAVANSMWWYDSKFESGRTAPPAVSDHYPLVSAYGGWDDHDPRNVVPLVNDLAGRMSTNNGQPGTLPADMATGIRDYLSNKQLAISYTVTYNDTPSWDWVKDEVKRSEDVVLLLGFWEQQQDGWKRLGGHYVTAAGVSCYGDTIAVSDPWRDNAEMGGPGEASTPLPHPHPAAAPDTIHNDAKLVSHDIYGLVKTNTPGGKWGLARYVAGYAEIANFMGINVPLPLARYQAEGYRNGEIVAVVERAIAVSPAPTTAVLRLEPATVPRMSAASPSSI